ncbi:Ger(x)C family spore germination C-terminal domain-containing protein [Alicyclobacillus sendaiensis]|uniref:Ger(X)C family spore germination C-terminal domain-containing protein n=1 Tax=Alicyclobacillus sendaiensis PA2 TaxID=3029425 RepID=A0ABT6XVQ5_ALISE|nr:Ger(x)C family spore germination C-terminal domain-containing protein [Alicyclobacillus sendaiensis]MDI9259165.1 Ger(x)C family spore germination C-terminal domain-containing protein [Alicyclobacillus sendaiensis PA2]
MTTREAVGKRRRAISAAVLCAVLVTGCDYNDIDHLYIATGMGVDRGRQGVRLSMDLVQPGGAGNPATGDSSNAQGNAPDRIVSAEGATFEEAMSTLQAKLFHALYLQHNALVLFSEDAVRDFAPIADALERNRQLRRSQLWVVTPMSAESVFRESTGQREPISLVIRDLVDEASRREACLASDELHVVKALLRPSGVAPLAAVDEGPDGLPEIQGLAYLRRDGKLDIVDRAQLLDNAWWLGRTLDVREAVPWSDGGHRGVIGVHWLRTSTRRVVDTSGGSPRLRVVWRGTGEIERWQASEAMSAEAFTALERAIREDVEHRLARALDHVRAVDMDAFGLANACSEKGIALHPGAWKYIPVEYGIEAHLIHGQLAATTPFARGTEGGAGSS